MNRAERRRQQKAAQRYEARKTFTKAEVDTMVETAYNLGIEHTLEAASNKLGIGPKRQEKIKEGLKLLQQLDFERRFQDEK